MRRIFVPNREGIPGEWRKLHSMYLHSSVHALVLLLLLLLLFTGIEFSLGGSSPYNSHK